jgi:hypothetical protein
MHTLAVSDEISGVVNLNLISADSEVALSRKHNFVAIENLGVLSVLELLTVDENAVYFGTLKVHKDIRCNRGYCKVSSQKSVEHI